MMFYVHDGKLSTTKKDKKDLAVELDINPSIVFCKPKYSDGKSVVACFITPEAANCYCRLENAKDKDYDYYFENSLFYDDRVVYPDAVQFELMINSYNKVYSMNKTYLYGNVNPQAYTYYRDNEKVYVEIIKYSDCTKNTEKEIRDKYENL